VKLILGLAVLAVAIIAGWQIASCELADYQLREERRELTETSSVSHPSIFVQ